MYQLALEQSYVPAQTDDVIIEMTVGDALREAAAATPDAEALVEGSADGLVMRTWTYRDLLADAERLALALSTRFEPGERIAVWAPNIPEWVLLEYASALAGLTLVTANPAFQPRELAYVLEQSGSCALFLVHEFRGNPMAEIAAEACAGLPNIRERVDLTDHDALFAAGARPAGLPDVSPGDAAQIQYTSGTTGFPKGAVLHHNGLVNNARLTAKRAGSSEGETWINFMPMFHTAGCAINTLGCLSVRGRLVIAKLFDPEAVNRLIEEQKVNVAMGVPTMMIGMLEAFDRTPRDFSALNVVISGGSMVPPELVRRVSRTFGCGFETVYGQTETSPVVTQTRLTDSIEDLCETVGQPLPQTEISIRDPKTNTVMPVAQVGEICIRGYCVMLEYNDNPNATAKTIDADGWLHTGDLGRMDARGFVSVTGRVKEMIIRGGENLFPAEIENVLLEHPAVAEVAVVGLPDEKWGEIVACFLRPVAGATPKVEELVSHCRAHLSPQKTPARWIIVADFPLTGSGKIQKFVLRDRYLEGRFKEAEA